MTNTILELQDLLKKKPIEKIWRKNQIYDMQMRIGRDPEYRSHLVELFGEDVVRKIERYAYVPLWSRIWFNMMVLFVKTTNKFKS